MPPGHRDWNYFRPKICQPSKCLVPLSALLQVHELSQKGLRNPVNGVLFRVRSHPSTPAGAKQLKSELQVREPTGIFRDMEARQPWNTIIKVRGQCRAGEGVQMSARIF